MVERLYSASWYRVARLKPKLQKHAQLHRHRYRGELWYVLQARSEERFFRFTPKTYTILALLDGSRTVEEIWNLACERLGDDAPVQDELVQLLGQLHRAGVLDCGGGADTGELFRQRESSQRRRRLRQWMSPLFWRAPLWDPNAFLDRWVRHARPVFSKAGLAIWSVTVFAAATLGVMHWSELTENVIDRVLAPQNLFTLWLLFPVLKIIHELGHGFAVKVFGGAVHEIGVQLLVVTPVPYVDASAASAFPRKRERIIVSAAGMMLEVFVASLALFLWLAVEPGAFRSVLYSVVFLASISTILFNINPLLRFDGYYILSDAIEIPNLRARGVQFLSHLLHKHVFRCPSQPPTTNRSEQAWLASYAVASFFYRVTVLVGICFFIASKFFFVGVLLALWGVLAWIVAPVAKSTGYLFTSPRLQTVRGRALATCGAALAVALLLTCLMPVPLRTVSEGVVWVPEDSIVRAPMDGFIESIVVESGDSVTPEQPLIVCRDPAQEAKVESLEANVQVLEAEKQTVWLSDRAAADMVDSELQSRREELNRERQRLASLTIRSRTDGTFVQPLAGDLIGRFARQGSELGYVVNLESPTARVVVPQQHVDLVRSRTATVDLRLVGDLSETVPASILREVPTASKKLPSSVLGSRGGGGFAVDPVDEQGLQTFERLFQFDLAMPAGTKGLRVGSRVYVRFNHGWEPLVRRWYRGAKRLFLSTVEA